MTQPKTWFIEDLGAGALTPANLPIATKKYQKKKLMLSKQSTGFGMQSIT